MAWALYYIELYICWQACSGAVKIMLWLGKVCINFGLRKQHLWRHNGWCLIAVNIHCRILSTALCWNGRSDWLLHRFGVRLYEDWGRSFVLQSGGKEQSDSDHKEHRTLHSDSGQHIQQCYQYMYWRLESFELLNYLSEYYPKCACRGFLCCRLTRGVQTEHSKVHYRC